MNLILAITTFLFSVFLVMLATRFGKKYLFAFSAFIIVATNATIGIQVDIFGFSLSWAVILYSMIYLITDILSEFYEKNTSYKLAISNLIVQIFFWIYIIFLSFPIEPSAGLEAHQSLKILYSIAPRITIAAIIASCGAFFDIFIYELIMRKFRPKKGVRGTLWFRNNISTILGQTLNTVLFFTIALYGVLPNLFQIVLFAIFMKILIALLDTPFLYLARLIRIRYKIID